MLYLGLVDDNSRVLATQDLRYRVKEVTKQNSLLNPMETKPKGNESFALGAGRAQKDLGL